MTRHRKFVRSLSAMAVAIAILCAGLPTELVAASPEIYTNAGNGIAINGYDPVAYFTQRKPVKGVATHSHSWKGATWHFSSAKNKALFAASPEKYAPQYGGYCAYAVSFGATAKTEPEAWSIVGNKLYLNYSLDVRKRWNSDHKGYIAKADKFWPGVLN